MNTEFDRYIKDQLRQGNTEIRKINIQDVSDVMEFERNKRVAAMNNEVNYSNQSYSQESYNRREIE